MLYIFVQAFYCTYQVIFDILKINLAYILRITLLQFTNPVFELKHEFDKTLDIKFFSKDVHSLKAFFYHF